MTMTARREGREKETQSYQTTGVMCTSWQKRSLPQRAQVTIAGWERLGKGGFSVKALSATQGCDTSAVSPMDHWLLLLLLLPCNYVKCPRGRRHA
jgi:hypothetical protein